MNRDSFNELAGQKFGTIIADPPWLYQKKPGPPLRSGGRGAVAEHHYPTMPNDALRDLPVGDLAADTACLLLWCTNPGVFGGRFSETDPEDIARAWGFEYRTLLTWVKTTRDGAVMRGGMGWYFRGCTEHVLVCTRGKLRIPSAERVPNVIMAPRSSHSTKPSHLHEFAEKSLPGPYLELFARSRRPGWASWGDQLPAVTA